MRNTRPIGAILLLAIAAIATIGAKHIHGGSGTVLACGFNASRTVSIGKNTIKAEVANTDASLQKGLGGRPCITANEAMLFTFDKPGQYPFWMKDMKFSIDIIWINANHKSVGVITDVKPSTYPTKYLNRNGLAQYVLEVQANRSKSLGIVIGTTVNF